MAIELKDIYTAGHSYRVAEISELIARFLQMDEGESLYIHIAGHLHDIGKIGIPDGILLKTGQLSNPEYEIIQSHPMIGSKIFERVTGLEEMAVIIRHHHERFDGKGYPDELKGDDIPLGAAIIAIADAFDAMTTPRSYRTGMSPRHAVAEIYANRGKQFNPFVAKIFFVIYMKDSKIIEEIISGAGRWRSEITYRSFNSCKKPV